jgi:hypothetical protein
MGFINVSYITNKNKRKIAKFRIKDDESLEFIGSIEYGPNTELGTLTIPGSYKLPSLDLEHSIKQNLPEIRFGIGEIIASITKLFGFKPCAPCNRRRKFLNKITPNFLVNLIKKLYLKAPEYKEPSEIRKKYYLIKNPFIKFIFFLKKISINIKNALHTKNIKLSK